jgi:hypothetical protein
MIRNLGLSLGQIVVIKKKCLSCSNKVETDSSFHLIFCSIKCWIKWKELSKQINEDYGYVNDN